MAVEGAQMSPALEHFLALQAEEPEEQDAEAAVASGSLSLGELDLTSSQVSVRGLEEQIQQFAESEVLRAILDQGCDPREYERQYERQLREAELGSVQDYIAESDNLVTLHDQITTCDDILASMEEMLGKFQSDLGNISTEIRSLQEQSQSMSVKLRNCKAAEGKLGAFLDNVAIPAGLIEGIVQSEIDEGFQEHLEQLNKKLEFGGRNKSVRETAAFRDVAPELERLRIKALTKARDFLMTRIYALRKPKTNIQILQQNVLLKYRYLVAFLKQHGWDVYSELRNAYIETLSRVLSSHFRAYLAAIERLQEDTVSASDVIGDTSSQPGMTGVMANLFSRGGAAGHKSKADAFSVGDRAVILHHLDQPALIPHVAESEGKRFPYEVLFRSVNKLLMDTATTEYLFCHDFFQEEAVFQELFAATVAVVESALAAQLQETFDLVGLLLLIRINNAHQLIMTKRRAPCLDGYLDRVNLLLWPRFKVIFDMQLASLKAYNPASFSEDVRVHMITQRYGLLTSSLLLLNSDFQDTQVEHNTDRLRYAAMDLLTKLSRQFRQRRMGIIFLIVNFTHIVQLLHEAASRAAQMTPAPGTTPPPTNAPLGMGGAETLKDFEDQLSTSTSIYVEELLSQHFGLLMAFVKQAEAALARASRSHGASDRSLPGFGVAEATPIAIDFSTRWMAAIEHINKETTKDFRGSPCGREVLKATMTRLLTVYSSFLDLLKREGPEAASLAHDCVTIPSIMYEIKRFNR